MKSITRKMYLSILAVVLSVFALGTTTFAWFTLTNTATVQPFQAEIVSDTGIEIALSDGSDPLLFDWKTTILTEDVDNYIAVKYADTFKFNNVTSINGRSFTDLDGTAVTSTEGGFLELNLHFRSNDITDINWNSVSLSSTPYSWRSNTAFTNEHGDVIAADDSFNVNAVDAFRVSVSGLISDVMTTTAFENPSSTTNVVLDEKSDADLTSTNGSVSYYTAVTGTTPTGSDSVTVVDTVQIIDGVQVLTMGDGAVADATYYGTITVRIWFEGWDANAYNSLLGSIITASLNFGA